MNTVIGWLNLYSIFISIDIYTFIVKNNFKVGYYLLLLYSFQVHLKPIFMLYCTHINPCQCEDWQLTIILTLGKGKGKGKGKHMFALNSEVTIQEILRVTKKEGPITFSI